MQKFIVRRASNDGNEEQPCSEAVRKEKELWTIEFDLLVGLLDFCAKYGEIIIYPLGCLNNEENKLDLPVLVIYDAYIE